MKRVPFFKMVENRLKGDCNVLKRLIEKLTEAIEQNHLLEIAGLTK